MTDRHDEWSREDDELVRRALLSLRDDVAHEPLPEPAQIRARAEGRTGGGEVVDLDARRSRRRSMTFLAGAAAAALVATGAGLLAVNQPPDEPVATSSTDPSSTGSSGGSSAAASTLRTLGPAEWQAVLGVPVEDTVQGEPKGHCFRPAKGTTWRSSSARAADTSRIAGQWVGTSPQGSTPLTESVDQSVTGCDGYSETAATRGMLEGDGSFRAWRNSGSEQPDVWWVEVSDGVSASFLAVTETDGRSYTDDDMRTLARGVLGEVDLTRAGASTTATATGEGTTTTDGEPATPDDTADDATTSTTTTTAPTTDETTDESTDPGRETSATTGSPSGSPTSSSGSTGPGSPTTTEPTTDPTTPSPTTPPIGPVPSSTYIPASDWSSQTLTGGQPTVGRALPLDGAGTTIDPCASTDVASRAGGLGIRAGEDDTTFGRQYVLMADTSADTDQMMSDLVGRYSTDCGGAADTRTLSDSSRVDTFALTRGGATTFVAVVRQDATSVTLLQLTSPSSAPEPLTDATADEELTRLAGLARR